MLLRINKKTTTIIDAMNALVTVIDDFEVVENARARTPRAVTSNKPIVDSAME